VSLPRGVLLIKAADVELLELVIMRQLMAELRRVRRPVRPLALLDDLFDRLQGVVGGRDLEQRAVEGDVALELLGGAQGGCRARNRSRIAA
jgi:hypothetical protein